ncbi:phosphoenolpyruvate--protein phosphotransferase [bacterium]|nr:phosphoenolpyruvate--protein phosphotransferase [bacterium]
MKAEVELLRPPDISAIGASSGIVIGPALLYDVRAVGTIRRAVAAEEVDGEIHRFRQAVRAARRDIQGLLEQADPSHVGVFEEMFRVQRLMLNDLAPEVEATIRERSLSAESAWYLVLNKKRTAARGHKSEVVRRGVELFNDLGDRVMKTLTGRGRISLSEIAQASIIVAHDLSPSDTAEIRRGMVLGFVTEIGGRTSHTAIMARSLAIPAVVAASGIMQMVSDGDTLIVDGRHGRVYINPDADTIRYYRGEQRLLELEEARLQQFRDLPAETLDGHKISTLANIELPNEVEAVKEYGASGIGLFRTEFLFLNRRDIPDEETQYEAYRQVAEAVHPMPVIIRTLDVGGDKFASHLDLGAEVNPFLGLRAIRFCLKRKTLFRVQLRAILRASALGNVRLMFPMIGSVEEMREAREFLELIKDEMRGQHPFDESMPVGAMIEIPSSVLVAGELAKYADFFSIGTNDLVQYTLAVDRVNDRIAYLYDPLHPAVLRMIAMTVEASVRTGRPLSVCGEMAADPLAVLVLLGFGIDHFSMSPISVPHIKNLVRSLAYEDARETTRRALAAESAQEVRRIALEQAFQLLPDYAWEG